MKKVIILTLLLVVLVGCAGSDVVSATATDWVWGVEELRSGAARIWLRHDNIAGYCTSDPALASKAKELEGELVQITFESKHLDDSEAWNHSGCNNLPTGYETSTPIFRLTDIKLAQ